MEKFAVIDVETNYWNEVMSVGVVASNDNNFAVTDYQYHVIKDVEQSGKYTDAVATYDFEVKRLSRKRSVMLIEKMLSENNINHMFAYNASFDRNHLDYFQELQWHDIISKAAYKQFNSKISDSDEVYKTGRLKKNLGAEPIYRLLTNQTNYVEKHNAIHDAVDELEIMRRLGYPVSMYNVIQ